MWANETVHTSRPRPKWLMQNERMDSGIREKRRNRTNKSSSQKLPPRNGMRYRTRSATITVATSPPTPPVQLITYPISLTGRSQVLAVARFVVRASLTLQFAVKQSTSQSWRGFDAQRHDVLVIWQSVFSSTPRMTHVCCCPLAKASTGPQLPTPHFGID